MFTIDSFVWDGRPSWGELFDAFDAVQEIDHWVRADQGDLTVSRGEQILDPTRGQLAKGVAWSDYGIRTALGIIKPGSRPLLNRTRRFVMGHLETKPSSPQIGPAGSLDVLAVDGHRLPAPKSRELGPYIPAETALLVWAMLGEQWRAARGIRLRPEHR